MVNRITFIVMFVWMSFATLKAQQDTSGFVSDTVVRNYGYVLSPYSTFTALSSKYSVLGLKTNLVYMASTSLNFGAEIALSRHFSVDATIGYNPWKFQGEASIRHWLAQPEFRYWNCRAFEGSFWGLHGFYGKYQIGYLPFKGFFRDYLYKGEVFGGGITYGFHTTLSGRWGLELSIGAGYARFNYSKYKCETCLDRRGTYTRNYLGPTKVGISLIYVME